ncbi:pimeloyl-ACP methyl ester carboxylesterase [Leifsonia sp. 563]|uniref:alpha/beta fold hydrolase n=1 Tax=Leifsonia sp. 563 TaxID=3156412 RepID=UPI00339362BC
MEQTMVETDAGPVTVHRTARESAVATILLHGAAGSWTTWKPMVAAAAAARGSAVPDLIVPDLPGWGDSPAEVASLDAAVLASSVATVARTLGYERWRVVGHSLGGFVALELAVREPIATESVVLVSATTFGGQADRRGTASLLYRHAPLMLLLGGMRVLAALGPAGLRLVRGLERMRLLPLLIAPLFSSPVPGSARELARDLRPAAFVRAVACARRYPAAERWARIRCPVLSLHGDRDVFVTAADDAGLAAIVPGLRTRILPATGHFAHVEHPSLLATLGLGVAGEAGGDEPPLARVTRAR